MTKRLLDARRLHTALAAATHAAKGYVEMLEIKATSEQYVDALNTTMNELAALTREFAEEAEADADAQEVLDELEDEALEVVAQMERDEESNASFARKLEADAEADVEADELAELQEWDDQQAELETRIKASLEADNRDAIEDLAVQNVAAGLEVDGERFMDGINRAENYLPPLAALTDAEQIEVERVLNDAEPFPSIIDAIGEDCCEGEAPCPFDEPCENGGTAEPVQSDAADDTGTGEEVAEAVATFGADAFSGLGFGGLVSGGVPDDVVDAPTIFDYAPETD